MSPSLPSQNVDGCSPLSNEGEEARGERSMKNFSLFIARCDSISFALLLAPLSTSSIILELAHSIKVPQSIFQEIENERCFIRNAGSYTSLLFNSNVLHKVFYKLKKSRFTTLREKRATVYDL